MKRIFLAFFLMLLLPWSLTAAQAASSDAEIELTMAMLSMSSYSDELNLLTRQHLQDMGWQYTSEETVNQAAEGRYHLVARELAADRKVLVLAFPGTERLKDAEVDLRLGRVVFGGTTPEEFQQVAANTAAKSAAKPLVHRGFHDYTQTALFQRQIPALGGLTAGEALARELQAHPEESLYLTGHSLGGAVATLAAARLSDMGVRPQQLHVITFGAPAVGNESFARTYEHKLQLTRITMAGDPVKSALQSYSKGYVQFGKKVVWQQHTGIDRFAHDMVAYLDQALRNYQDSRPVGSRPWLLSRVPQQVSGGILAAPIAVDLAAPIAGNAPYIERALQEALQTDYTPLQLVDLATWQQETEQHDGYTLRLQVTGERIRTQENDYRINLIEELYDAQGNLLDLQLRSTTTTELTPLEAALYLFYSGQEELDQALAVKKTG